MDGEIYGKKYTTEGNKIYSYARLMLLVIFNSKFSPIIIKISLFFKKPFLCFKDFVKEIAKLFSQIFFYNIFETRNKMKA